MIKFLIDENVGSSIISYLMNSGFDTKLVSEFYPSRDDLFIVKTAYKQKRIIVTNDKDFGYLIVKSGLPVISVILFRFKDESPVLKVNAIKTILSLPEEKILNHFIVASEKKIRLRPLNS
jgi:predicted nuclease of predicted toxin-antitoxin system